MEQCNNKRNQVGAHNALSKINIYHIKAKEILFLIL